MLGELEGSELSVGVSDLVGTFEGSELRDGTSLGKIEGLELLDGSLLGVPERQAGGRFLLLLLHFPERRAGWIQR